MSLTLALVSICLPQARNGSRETQSLTFSHLRPSHVIAFVRPKEGVPAKFATFKVPLQFNKLDLRDYLYHAYNVGVRSVRSFVIQKRPERRGRDGVSGQWYRPRAEKMMTAELEQPFVWPAEPKDKKDKAPWDKEMHDRTERERERQMKFQEKHGRLPIPDAGKDKRLKAMADQAQALLQGRTRWSNHVRLDDRWKEAEKGDLPPPKK